MCVCGCISGSRYTLVRRLRVAVSVYGVWKMQHSDAVPFATVCIHSVSFVSSTYTADESIHSIKATRSHDAHTHIVSYVHALRRGV